MTENSKQPPSSPTPRSESSSWSLESLQQLKGLNLASMHQQQPQQSPQKPQNSLSVPMPSNQAALRPKQPPIPSISATTKMFSLGRILQKIKNIFLVEAEDCKNLADFDNWIYDQNRNRLGFVVDIFGKVEKPYYVVEGISQQQGTKEKEIEKKDMEIGEIGEMKTEEKFQNAGMGVQIGDIVYYAEGSKTITQQDINSIRQKSAMQDVDVDSQQSQSQNQEDSQRNVVSHQVFHKREPTRRRGSFEEQRFERERTRQKKHHHNRDDIYGNKRRNDSRPYDRRNQMKEQRQQRNDRQDRQKDNQKYLQSIYNNYYIQMMQLYNGQNGMPLPMPPVFPMYQPHPQSQPFQLPPFQPLPFPNFQQSPQPPQPPK